MSMHRLRQRLRESGQRLRAGAYARLARYWNAGVRPEQEHRVEQLFRNLVDGEVEAGTPLESLLARLPHDMVREIRFGNFTSLWNRARVEAITHVRGEAAGRIHKARRPLPARSATNGRRPLNGFGQNSCRLGVCNPPRKQRRNKQKPRPCPDRSP